MAGRTPKPTALKLVTGNPGKRAINKAEPDPAYLTDLTPPAWLPAQAAEVWNDLAPKFAKAHLLTELDVELFAQGCVAVSQFRRAAVKAGDALVKSKHEVNDAGDLVEVGEHVNPWLVVQSMASKQAGAVLREFGAGPVSRSRIMLQPQLDLFSGNDKAKSYFS